MESVYSPDTRFPSLPQIMAEMTLGLILESREVAGREEEE